VNEQEQEIFEAELRRAKAARLPEHFAARLQAGKPDTEPAQSTPFQPVAAKPRWRMCCAPNKMAARNGCDRMAGMQAVLRWLAPAMAVVVLGLLSGG